MISAFREVCDRARKVAYLRFMSKSHGCTVEESKKSRLAEKFGFGAPAVMVEGADFFAGWSNKSGVADF